MYLFTHRNPEMALDRRHSALVLADIQNDFLTESGSYYPLIEESLKKNQVLDYLEELLRCAKENGLPVIHSPHYYYPTDGQWVAAGGSIAHFLGTINFVRRKDPLSLEGFAGSGAISLPVAGQFTFDQYPEALALAAKYNGKAILRPNSRG
jgi:nicotinamidase-related amidase